MRKVDTTEGLGGFAYFMFIVALYIFFGTCWIANAVKFCKCDFKAPYKGEIIHGIGLLGPASVITVWFDDK